MAAAVPFAEFQNWPEEFSHVQAYFTQLRRNNPRYESTWFAGLVAMFNHIFPTTTPRRFYLRPQFILRAPVGGVVPPEDAPGPDLPDPEPLDDEEEELEDVPAGDISITSQGYPVQGRGQGREGAIRIPDFIIDYLPQIGVPRRFALLIEVKASTRPGQGDIRRFTRYARRVLDIANAGVAIGNIIMMLIAGGTVYTWDFDHLPTELHLRHLSTMDSLQVDDVRFLNMLVNVRNTVPVPA